MSLSPTRWAPQSTPLERDQSCPCAIIGHSESFVPSPGFANAAPKVLADLFKDIHRYIIVGHRVIHPVGDLHFRIMARSVFTFAAVPKGPSFLDCLIQTCTVMETEGISLAFPVDWIPLLTGHG
jgi:hypothetical protein